MNETITFALRTEDSAWIERNQATPGEAGRVYVQVPASEVTQTTRCGKPWLTHVFADVPADALNAAIGCPAAWAC